MNWRTIGLIAILAMLLFLTARVLADVKAERIKIKMSDTSFEKVEEVVRNIDGVIQTHWDDDAKELEIVFEQDKTTLQEIEKTISEAGFDTPNFKASEEDKKRVLEESNESGQAVQ